MSKKSGDDDDYHDSSQLASWANINFNEIDLGDRIGGGGVGVIYKGYFNDKPVALKTLFDSRISPDLKKEYMDELLIMSKVKHSNIVKFMGACMTPPNLCFVMELCECSLFHLLHMEKRNFSMLDSVVMATDIASAMEYLHSLSPVIIHRDLKSHNVLKSFDGSYKVCDFGLVKVQHTTAGTPAYMAPELIDNRPFNKSVDVYAFGMLLWEIFSKEVPFYQWSIAEIRERVVAGDRPRIPSYGFTHRVGRLVQKCWNQRPDERPSFTEVVDQLILEEREAPKSAYTENMKDDALEDLIIHSAR